MPASYQKGQSGSNQRMLFVCILIILLLLISSTTVLILMLRNGNNDENAFFAFVSGSSNLNPELSIAYQALQNDFALLQLNFDNLLNEHSILQNDHSVLQNVLFSIENQAYGQGNGDFVANIEMQIEFYTLQQEVVNLRNNVQLLQQEILNLQSINNNLQSELNIALSQQVVAQPPPEVIVESGPQGNWTHSARASRTIYFSQTGNAYLTDVCITGTVWHTWTFTSWQTSGDTLIITSWASLRGVYPILRGTYQIIGDTLFIERMGSCAGAQMLLGSWTRS